MLTSLFGGLFLALLSFSVQKWCDVEQPQHLPPLGEAVAARASESTSIRPSRHQLPPLHLPPWRVSESVPASSSPNGCKQGCESEDTNNSSFTFGPAKRGSGSGGGGGGKSPSSAAAAANADPNDEALQSQPQPEHNTEAASNVVTPPGVGQRGAAVVSQMKQGLSNGTMSMLQVLSQSAAHAAETEKEKRAESTGSLGGPDSVDGSTDTQFSHE